eukprot:2882435-Rhodomonas_salina.1
MTADPDRNALRYDYYSPQGAACFRYFNVSGSGVANGTFLGIPRDATVAAALDERTNETVSGLCPFRVGRAPLLTCSAFQVGIT